MNLLSFVTVLLGACTVSTALKAVIEACTVPNTAALTFDDGPYEYLEDISNTLTAAGAKGTFFFNGDNWDCIYNNDAKIQYAYGQGHQIGSHTWHHTDLTTLSWDQIHDEMWRVEQAVQRITGAYPAFTRPPYGSYNNLVRQAADTRNQTLVNWDFDSGDSTGSTAQQSMQAYDQLGQKHPRTVLALNHEPYETTAHVVLPHAIQVLQRDGYRLVTLAECLNMQPYLSVGAPANNGPWSC